MKLIHTSDWHIGRTLYGRKRYKEFEGFLNWLIYLIDKENIDALLVAGDVFDNSAPSNQALELYYNFLCQVTNSKCRHVVITAGNHDSPSLLNASKDILKLLDVHVIGHALNSPKDETLTLRNADGRPELIVCAVPYLRDRDIRLTEAGESTEDKSQKAADGIRKHYCEVCDAAERIRSDLDTSIPIVAMGHLFATGGQTIDGDGVRELYVGSLLRVETNTFPKRIDYLALGHLHTSQIVGGFETRRYSGSPLPMSFNEAKQQKCVLTVTFSDDVIVEKIPAPCFQKLETIRGDWSSITKRIEQLKSDDSASWLEIVYEGSEIISNLPEKLKTVVKKTKLEILRVKNNRSTNCQMIEKETLDDVSVNDVFERCLDTHNVPRSQRDGLINAFCEITTTLHEEDKRAK